MKKFWKRTWKPAVAVAAALVLALGVAFGYPALKDNFKAAPGGSSATSSRYGSASSSYAGPLTEDGTSSDGVFVVGSEETAESAAPENATGGNGVSSTASKAQTGGSKPSGQSSGKTGQSAGSSSAGASSKAPSTPKNPWDRRPTLETMEADCDLIAERVLYWINKFRAEEGKPAAICLTGITMTFAKMRAQSLVGDFRHDPLKSREIATKLKFGRYMNPPEAVKKWNNPNIPQEEIEAEKNKPPYYEPPVGEAIAAHSTFYGSTIDGSALGMARALRESSGHWAYVGIRKYLTIAVATEGKQTYCALITDDEDSDACPDGGWTKKDLEYYGPDYVDPESPYL